MYRRIFQKPCGRQLSSVCICAVITGFFRAFVTLSHLSRIFFPFQERKKERKEGKKEPHSLNQYNPTVVKEKKQLTSSGFLATTGISFLLARPGGHLDLGRLSQEDHQAGLIHTVRVCLTIVTVPGKQYL